MEIDKEKFYSMTTEERIVLSQELYRFLAPIMNEVHGVNYSERFWTIILAQYVTTINTRRKQFVKSKISSKAPLEPINSFVVPNFKLKLILRLKYFAKAYKTRNLLKKNLELLKSQNEIAFGFHDKESVKPDFASYMETYYPFPQLNKNRLCRDRVRQIASRYASVFDQNVILQLPQSAVEYFENNMSRIPMYTPAEKSFHMSMLQSNFMRYMVAKYAEQGAQLNYYQHGAFYGEYKFYSPYEWEQLICDHYYTWGWKMNEKDIPWKAYRLNKFARNFRKFNCEKKYDCMIVFPQITAQSIADFQLKTGRLINTLDRTKYASLLIRPRPSATDLKFDEQFRFIQDSRAIIDDGKSVIGALIAASKIVIQYNYPSTNLLECLYVDQPSVVILTNKTPTDVVKPFYDFFIEKGVFHYDLNTLADHLNAIEIESWWNEIINHPIYQEFKRTFIREY